jgi:energy-coupling factor transporter transmembrane protein EcfT
MLTIRSRVTTSSFHPLTWWLWAVLLATTLLLANTRAISVAIVTSTLVLALSMQRQTAGFYTFRCALRFAVIAFCFRMFIAIFIGVPMPGRTIFTLPQLQLPDFLVGIRIGGPVTTQRLLSGFDEAVLLVALILIFATANALSNPHSLLRILPQRFYGLGLAGVISTSVAPQAARGIERVRSARRLRGQSSHGIRSWRGVALPVLEDSLERSIDLAAGLESRGYGYFPRPTRYRPETWKFRDTLAISGGLYGLVIVIASPSSMIVAPILVALFVLTPVFSS